MMANRLARNMVDVDNAQALNIVHISGLAGVDFYSCGRICAKEQYSGKGNNDIFHDALHYNKPVIRGRRSC